MTERAKLVNQALDTAVPLKYPEDLTESMRLVGGRFKLNLKTFSQDEGENILEREHAPV